MVNEAEQEKSKGMGRVKAANPAFTYLMGEVLYQVATRKAEFTALDLYPLYMGPEATDPRAMGPVFSKAAKNGIITKIPLKLIKSGRRSDHNKDLQVWKSLVFVIDPIGQIGMETGE